jgi:uncharacterized protein (TIGR02453 family)
LPQEDSAVPADSYFTRDSLKFLSELRTHNNRDWFQSNKERYETQVRDPMLRLIADLAPRLRKINPHMVADPRPMGGSMMRIYRDIRFSKDKSPYKTAVAAHFGHAKGKDGAAPAYYMHIQPGGSLIGAGIWRPEPAALKKIRDAIVADSKRWQRVTAEGQRGSACKMTGESLQRVPRGYDPDHPLAEELKRKDFTLARPLADREIVAPGFLALTLATFKKTAGFVEFLAEAVGLA